jgi:hypothetical protein
MMTLVYVIAMFLLSLLLHIVIHRIFTRRGILTFKSTATYVVGLTVVVFFAIRGLLQPPITSVLLYSLLSLVAIMFYLTPYLGGETPASMILGSFKKRKQQSFADLVNVFTNTGLIWKRIEDLQTAGLIKKTGTNYLVTPKGKIVSTFVLSYQKLFNRKLVG